MAKAAGFGAATAMLVRIEAIGAGDRARTHYVQLGKLTMD